MGVCRRLLLDIWPRCGHCIDHDTALDQSLSTKGSQAAASSAQVAPPTTSSPQAQKAFSEILEQVHAEDAAAAAGALQAWIIRSRASNVVYLYKRKKTANCAAESFTYSLLDKSALPFVTPKATERLDLRPKL